MIETDAPNIMGLSTHQSPKSFLSDIWFDTHCRLDAVSPNDRPVYLSFERCMNICGFMQLLLRHDCTIHCQGAGFCIWGILCQTVVSNFYHDLWYASNILPPAINTFLKITRKEKLIDLERVECWVTCLCASVLLRSYSFTFGTFNFPMGTFHFSHGIFQFSQGTFFLPRELFFSHGKEMFPWEKNLPLGEKCSHGRKIFPWEKNVPNVNE